LKQKVETNRLKQQVETTG